MDEYSCTTREAAEALGVCIRTAQLWAEQGRLVAWKTPGGHRRILRESVFAELGARHKAAGVAPATFDVLIVEGDPVLRQTLQSTVGEVSPMISVRTVGNGVEALLSIGEHPPQVLITDLVMPARDGVQLLNTLAVNPLLRALRIIVVTALSEAEIAEQGGLPAGTVTFYKPLQSPRLAAMVRACHDRWSRCARQAGG